MNCARPLLFKLQMRKFIFALVILLTSIFISPSISLAAENDLGIALQVLKGGEGSSSNINKNNNLWFVIEPGKSGTRSVVINSASKVAQKISFSIAGRSQLNGELKYDAKATSVVNEWASYSENNFTLKPGQSKEIVVTIKVPKDATREVLQPALLAKATGVKASNAQYKIPTAMQISQGIFLGVGTVDEFTTKFTIDDVYGENGDSGHSLQVKISNTGKTPIAITGNLQLSNATFSGPTIGPLPFFTSTIYPGESGVGEILVGEEIPEDKYRIQVQATQGIITETRNFEKNIDFRGLAQLYSNLMWIGIFVVSLVIAFIALRALRKPAPPKVEAPVTREPSYTPRPSYEQRLPIRSSVTAAPVANQVARKQTENIVILFLVYAGKELRKKLLARRSN